MKKDLFIYNPVLFEVSCHHFIEFVLYKEISTSELFFGETSDLLHDVRLIFIPSFSEDNVFNAILFKLVQSLDHLGAVLINHGQPNILTSSPTYCFVHTRPTKDDHPKSFH